MKTTKTATDTTPESIFDFTPGTNAAIARKIARAEAALAASIERLEAAINDLRTGSSMSQPGDIGRVAAEVEARRGILIGLREAAST